MYFSQSIATYTAILFASVAIAAGALFFTNNTAEAAWFDFAESQGISTFNHTWFFEENQGNKRWPARLVCALTISDCYNGDPRPVQLAIFSANNVNTPTEGQATAVRLGPAVGTIFPATSEQNQGWLFFELGRQEFFGNEVTIEKGERVELSWACQPYQTVLHREDRFWGKDDTDVLVKVNMTSNARGDGFTANKLFGSTTVAPTKDTTYTLTCERNQSAIDYSDMLETRLTTPFSYDFFISQIVGQGQAEERARTIAENLLRGIRGEDEARELSLTVRVTEPPSVEELDVIFWSRVCDENNSNCGNYRTSEQRDERTIDPGENVNFKWEGEGDNLEGCYEIRGAGFNTKGRKKDEDRTITEPDPEKSERYTVECRSTDSNESPVRKTIRITTNPLPPEPEPIVRLQVKNTDGDNIWKEEDIEINADDDNVHLKWSITNGVAVTSCSGSDAPGNGNFTFTNRPFSDNRENNIFEPRSGNSRTYTIVCETASGVESDPASITVAKRHPAPTVNLMYRECNSGNDDGSCSGEIDPGNSVVNIASDRQVRLVWTSQNTDLCKGRSVPSGQRFSTRDLTNDSDNDITEPTPGNSTRFIITCDSRNENEDAAEDSVTIATYPIPTAILKYRHHDKSADKWLDWTIATGDPLIIDEEDEIRLAWDGTTDSNGDGIADATSCNVTSGASGGLFSTDLDTNGDGIIDEPNAVKGKDLDIGEPNPGRERTFAIRCSGPGGTSAPASLTVETNDSVGDPVVRLQVSKLSEGGWIKDNELIGNFTIDPGEHIGLNWFQEGDIDPISCSVADATNPNGTFDTNGAISEILNTNGEVDEPPEGATYTYAVKCDGPDDLESNTAIINVEARDGGPTLDPVVTRVWAYKQSDPSGTRTRDTLVVGVNEEVTIEWDSSSNADRCDGGSSPTDNLFMTGGLTDSEDPTITEPSSGQTAYIVNCIDEDTGVDKDDSVIVRFVGAPTLETDKTSVRKGEQATLTWNTQDNDPTKCTLIGPGLNLNPLSNDPLKTTDTATVTINDTSTYVLSCPGGDPPVTIRLVPQIFES